MNAAKSTFAVLSLVALCAGGAGVAQADGDFQAACWNIRLKNQCDRNSYCNLGATCRRREGGFVNTEAWWNLDNEIGNVNGVLFDGVDGFSQSCDSIRLEDAGGRWWLLATCNGEQGNRVDTRFDLTMCLANDDGNLKWVCNTDLVPRGVCVDSSHSCSYNAYRCYEPTWTLMMARYCPKTCGWC